MLAHEIQLPCVSRRSAPQNHNRTARWMSASCGGTDSIDTILDATVNLVFTALRLAQLSNPLNRSAAHREWRASIQILNRTLS